ncbi:MAG TPA: NADH:flavin oxidoreductase/NADH oxidase [Daejeonella sp.]|nr:NADH:flavin oxidoreductase/NADH oxidase [Daejeonella sp.]
MATLFDTLKIKDIQLKNRMVVSPMCQYSSVDGFANDWHLVHLGSRAVGGAALVMTEATAISPEGRISPHDLGIWRDEHISYLKRIADFIEREGAVPGMQLAHSGRKASCVEPWNGGRQISFLDGGWQPWAPSSIPYKENSTALRVMSLEDIERVIADFKAAAARALKAGFKVLEIHAAHGYLIHTFLSPISNLRQDEYGGSFENRIRFLLNIIDQIQVVWPANYPLLVRISATDWVEGGWALEDSIRLAQLLKEKNIDLIDCSSGGLVPNVKITTGPGYQVPFADALRNKTGIKTGAVGLITEINQADEIIRKGQADVILLARELLRHPYFPLQAARQLGLDVPWPPQYERAKLK